MTKSINIKELEKYYFDRFFLQVDETYGLQVWEWFKQTIKQLVESVPVEKKVGGNGKVRPGSGYDWYNQHVQETKQWKKKILEELKIKEEI